MRKSRLGRRSEAYRCLIFRKMFERFSSLYGDGYESEIESLVAEDLVSEFGPVAEARYERGPFTVADQFEHVDDDYSYSRLPDEFMAEHLASVERMKGE